MHIGMLWFVETPGHDLKSTIQTALEYYRKKYKREPNLCLVNPGMLAGSPLQLGHLTVRAYPSVLPRHLWIGVEDQS